MRDIKAQVDTFTSDNGSLEQAISAADTAKNVKNIVVGETGDADEPIEGSALFKVLSAESNAAGSASAASNSAADAIKARSEILGSGDNVSYTDPADGSALKEIRDAKGVVDEFIKEGGDLDNVINDLKYNDTANALSAALSAYQGKVLNESKLNLSGGEMTGTLILNGDPSNSNDAATKNYVDTYMPSLVSTDRNGVMSKEDKAKLDGIEEEANKYTHPGTHPASMIEEDDTHKFITNDEKKLLSRLGSQLGNLRIVIADAVPDDADENTITIIRP